MVQLKKNQVIPIQSMPNDYAKSSETLVNEQNQRVAKKNQRQPSTIDPDLGTQVP